jgi:hypothetical protein
MMVKGGAERAINLGLHGTFVTVGCLYDDWVAPGNLEIQLKDQFTGGLSLSIPHYYY